MTRDEIARWAEEGQDAPVALTLRQKLVSVEGPDAVIFPPTYASEKQGEKSVYNIDDLVDGTKVALIDSVGSQANRMEPIFKEPPYAELVPQIVIKAGNHRPIPIFEVGHRVADALVRSSRPLSEEVAEAFNALAEGNAEQMAKLAPTSLVFGVWDSRGEGMKVPRLVNSVIRAFDVSVLKRSAQYIPALQPEEYAALLELNDKERKELLAAQDNSKSPFAQAGFVHVPSTNDPGGVIAHGGIYRTVTVNLVALRKLDGDNAEALRRYILGLALVAATWPQDGFLRQGCQLVIDTEEPGQWQAVHRDGSREGITLSHEDALAFAREAADAFGVEKEERQAEFDARLAREVLKQAKKA